MALLFLNTDFDISHVYWVVVSINCYVYRERSQIPLSPLTTFPLLFNIEFQVSYEGFGAHFPFDSEVIWYLPQSGLTWRTPSAHNECVVESIK